jgi:DNA-directed RNA polymerase subunit RPC12/RpoP
MKTCRCVLGKRKSFDSGKEDKEDVYGELRRLRKIIKVKDREINRLEKHITNNKSYTPAPRDPDRDDGGWVAKEEILSYKPRCTDCGSENVKQWELDTPSGNKKYITCNGCGKRRLLNPKAKE